MLGDVRIGIIGVGSWGRNHLRVMKEIGAAVRAICDIDLERAEELAKRFGIEKFYNRVDEMLRKEELDAVTICTPSVTHAECALRALEARAHVFVEKPMASSVEECLKIIDAMKSNRRIVMTGFIERFNPAVAKALEFVKAGEIGVIITLHGRRIGRWPERIGDIGVVKDMAIHDIDLVRYLLGENPAEVYARGGSHRHKFDDYVQAILTFVDGSKTAFIETNWLTPRKKREMQITGSEGVISIQFLTQEVSLEKGEYVLEPIIKQSEPLKLELQHFLECVAEGRNPSPDAYDGLKAVAIAEAILESMQRNKIIEIDIKSIL